MTGVKQIARIASLFLLLFAVVTVPALLLERRSGRLLNTATCYSVEAVELGGAVAAEADLGPGGEEAETGTLWERLALINSADVAIEGEKYELYVDLEEEAPRKELLPHMEEQLGRLVELNALPPLFFSGVRQVSFTRKTYMQTPGESWTEGALSLWDIQASYEGDTAHSVKYGVTINYNEGLYVRVLMDAETYALYEITIIAKNDPFLYPAEISAQGYLDYLQTFSSRPEEDAGRIAVDGRYGERAIYLAPVEVGGAGST